MLIFEIVTPGMWLDYQDRAWTGKIEGLIRHLESQFFEANLSLNLFLKADANDRPRQTSENWEYDNQRRSELRKLVQQKHPDRTGPDGWDIIEFETEIQFKREQWEKGRLPREFEHNQVFIFARAFLYAMDAFDKFLGVLSREEGIPVRVAALHVQLSEDFPDLRNVRNSAQHPEDRARGLGASGKPLDLKPVDNELIKVPGGTLLLNCLIGTKYGCTMADGHYGEVDVSPESMEKLQRILQEVLNSFQWRGPKKHSPSI